MNRFAPLKLPLPKTNSKKVLKRFGRIPKGKPSSSSPIHFQGANSLLVLGWADWTTQHLWENASSYHQLGLWMVLFLWSLHHGFCYDHKKCKKTTPSKCSRACQNTHRTNEKLDVVMPTQESKKCLVTVLCYTWIYSWFCFLITWVCVGFYGVIMFHLEPTRAPGKLHDGKNARLSPCRFWNRCVEPILRTPRSLRLNTRYKQPWITPVDVSHPLFLGGPPIGYGYKWGEIILIKLPYKWVTGVIAHLQGCYTSVYNW